MLVTRFAPSPTGYLHVGSARTALFDWLLARRHGGRMILRIEDTDLKRNTPTATQQVISDLRWLGLEWDEGPDVGGPNGPYLQSQRLDIYRQYAQKLLESDRAYYCFDTSEELQANRNEAAAKKQTFAYRAPKNLPDEKDVQKARAEGRPVTIRMAVPQDKPIIVHDVVRGEVTFDPAEISDFIIVKSDGFPTYHFACVVDDELMEVTHIIRGQEHLMNTPGHQVLQDALGFRRPTYAHMSVTVSEGGGKLSKRERAKTLREAIKKNPAINITDVAQAGNISPDEMKSFLAGDSTPDSPAVTAMAALLGIPLPEINVVDFFRSGYLPEAMMNFVALLGWNPGDNREIMTREELIEAFDLNRLTKTNSLFDRQKLPVFNTEHLKMVDPDTLRRHFKAYLQEVASPLTQADDKTLAYMLKICEGARTLKQIEEKCLFAFVDEVTYDPQAVKKVLQKDGVSAILTEIKTTLENLVEWTEAAIHQAVEKMCRDKGVGMGKVAQPIRVAITGTTISPPIGDSLILLGKDHTLKRITKTLEYMQTL
ncbi:MAG: glutamate--tRNA ligase [Sedimentisphaerales bacterium]|nr:glutamate--tRNA ligase [Sedimentisphaerales bacterium]